MLSPLSSIALSHFERFVDDVGRMVEFYSRYLGFVITDRGAGSTSMVFLGRYPRVHHHLVLNPRQLDSGRESPADHIAFRVDSMQALRQFHASLGTSPVKLQAVSPGSICSIYFRDPQGNRIEPFTETPRHVNQPCRFEIDFALPHAALIEFTRQQIKDLPGYREVSAWRRQHVEAIQPDLVN